LKGKLLLNPKGISVLFLLMAMLLVVGIGYVFSYLIPTKQESVVFPIQSTQAFFIGQSGFPFITILISNFWVNHATRCGAIFKD
jgi:hypothetical protein